MDTRNVIQELAEYYGKVMSPGTIKIYLGTLDDIPADLLDLAAKELIKTGHPFMPRVSELRKVAGEIKRASGYEQVDPLKLIPGAAQTEADLDERYGTREEHREICRILEDEDYDSLTAEQEALLRGERT
jgi:hypothetical protein